MPPQLILLADDRCVAQLGEVGDLPEGFVVDGRLQDAPGALKTPSPIVRYDPSWLIPPEAGGQDKAGDRKRPHVDEEGRDELFARLLGGLVCHLVVLENEPEQWQTALGPDEVIFRGPTDLSALTRWYSSFRAEAARRVAHRKDEYRHVLMLIAADELEPSPQEYAAFRELLDAEAEHRPFDFCYVMLRRLELGRNDVAFSRYVWPICVSRLLVRLLAVGTGPPAARPVTRVWRSFELSPEVDGELITEECRRALSEAHRTLTEAVSPGPEDWDARNFAPGLVDIPPVALPEKSIPEATEWHTYQARSAAEAVASPQRWGPEMAAASREFAACLSNLALMEDPPSYGEAQTVWATTHSNPAVISNALGEEDIAGPHDLPERLKDATGQWDAIAEADNARRRAADEARECAEVLVDAQNGYVEIEWRLILGLASTAAVGWAAWWLFHGLLGRLGPAFSVTVGGAAGAFAAAIIPSWLERQRGRRAVEVFRDLLRDLDAKTKERHEKCQECVQKAYSFWQQLRTVSAVNRLKALLRRVQTAFDNELRAPDPEVSGTRDGDESGESPRYTGERARRAARQRLAFVSRTRLAYPVNMPSVDRPKLDEAISRQVRRFVEVLWGPFCHNWDTNDAGNLPLRVLIPLLRAFQRSFRFAIRTEIHRQALRYIDAEAEESWIAQIQDVRNAGFYHYMSSIVTEDKMDVSRTAAYLLLRPDMVEGRLAQEFRLRTAEAERAEFLLGMGIVGYLHEETPVNLGLGESNLIEIVADAG